MPPADSSPTPCPIGCGVLPAAPVAIFSLLSNWRAERFEILLLTLGFSLHQYAKRVPRYIFFPEDEVPVLSIVRRMRAVGWVVCSVPPARRLSTRQSVHARRWPSGFSKLALFRLVQFERLLFVDADFLAVRPLVSLLSYPMRAAVVAAAGDVHPSRMSVFTDRHVFNCGLLLIRPNATFAAALLRFLDPAIHNATHMERTYGRFYADSETPLLIEFFRRRKLARVRLPWRFNANTALLGRTSKADVAAWSDAQPIALVHFTLGKPHDGCEGACTANEGYRYATPCRWWNQSRRDALAAVLARESNGRLAGDRAQGAAAESVASNESVDGVTRAACAELAAFAPIDLNAFDGAEAAPPPVSPEFLPQGNRSLHGTKRWPGCERAGSRGSGRVVRDAGG